MDSAVTLKYMLKLVTYASKEVIAKSNDLAALKLQLLYALDNAGSSIQAVIRECESGKEIYRVKSAYL